MDKKQEIKNKIWKIWQTLTLANECFEYAYYLYNPPTKEEQKYVEYSADFAFIRNILWRTVIIELGKLLREPDPAIPHIFNINYFIAKFKKGGKYEQVGINESLIKGWEEAIMMNKGNAEKALIIWDKLYALSDNDKQKYLDNDLSFDEIKKIIIVFQDIINQLNMAIFDSETLINAPLFERNNISLLKILASADDRK